MTNNLDRKIDDLELSIRVMNGLKINEINTIKDLVLKTEGEILRTPNFGRKSLNEKTERINTDRNTKKRNKRPKKGSQALYGL